jgi:hypothetical protein
MKQRLNPFDQSELYRNGFTVFSFFNNFKGGVKEKEYGNFTLGGLSTKEKAVLSWPSKHVEIMVTLDKHIDGT